MKKSSKKKAYSTEFKEEAVKLAAKIGVQEAAKQLGPHPDSIKYWIRLKKQVGTKSNIQDQLDIISENKRLKKENEYLKIINKVLKKSTAIFSQDHMGNIK